MRTEVGSALREHIEQLCRQTGKSPEALGLSSENIPDEPDIPHVGGYLWVWFWELVGGRASNGFCPLPISWTEIEAWARLTSTDLSPYDALTLRRMDAAYLNAYAEAKQGKEYQWQEQHLKMKSK